MDLIIRARRLSRELIAGHVDNLKTFLMILLIHILDVLVVRREPASRGCIDDQHHLALVLFH